MGKKPTVKVEAYGLTRAREDTGLTPAELAELTGKRTHYFYMLESLKRSPSSDLQEAILEHLPEYDWDDVFRLVLVLPENPPTDTLYVEQGNNGRWNISLWKEEFEPQGEGRIGLLGCGEGVISDQ